MCGDLGHMHTSLTFYNGHRHTIFFVDLLAEVFLLLLVSGVWLQSTDIAFEKKSEKLYIFFDRHLWDFSFSIFIA